jgi:hypothetical protein
MQVSNADLLRFAVANVSDERVQMQTFQYQQQDAFICV